MHSKNILHSDLNSGNVNFDSDGSIKLIDLSRVATLTEQSQLRSTRQITKMLAHEILNETQYDKLVDV